MKFEFDLQNLAIAVILVMGLALGGMYVYNNILTPQEVVDGTTIPADEVFAGNLDVKTSENDFLSGGAHTSSNAKLYFYTLEPSSEADGVVISSSAKTIEIQRSSKGWAWISIHNEDDGYLITPWMESAFKNQNPRVKEVYYKDLDNDDKKEMIGKCWFGDIVVASGQDPEWTLNINWIDEDVSGITTDNPSDQTGLGETSGTAFTITWKISGCSAGDGFVIGKIYVVTNDTREGEDIRLEDLRLYGDLTVHGKTSWGTPVSTSAGDYEGYYFMPTEYTDPFNGILVYRGVQASDQLYVTLKGKLYLETNNKITVALYFETVGGDGTTAQVSDSVLLNEA